MTRTNERLAWLNLSQVVPESPLWLLGHRGPQQARLALRWLRQREDVEEEIRQIQNIMEDQSCGLTVTEPGPM